MKGLRLLDIVAELESGSRPKGGVRNGNGEIPSLGAEHLDGNGGFNFEKIKHISIQFFQQMGKGQILPGDILIVKDGATTGKVSFVGDEFPFSKAAINEHVFRLRVNEYQADQAYIFRFLQSPAGQAGILSDFRGATVGGIGRTFLEKVALQLPALAEQRRVAAILGKADKIRHERRDSLRTWKTFPYSVFLELFGDPVLNSMKWPEQRLQDVSIIQSGIAKGRKLDGQGAVEVPYMRVANVQDGRIALDDVKEIEVLPSDIERLRLKSGDILLTEGGDPDKLGRGAVWRGQIDPCIHQNHIFRVRPNETMVLPDYLSAIIGSPRGKRYFLRAAKQTTGIATINRNQLDNFPVLIPPLDLQKLFTRLIQKAMTMEQRLSNAAKSQEDLYSALLQEAFAGAQDGN